MNVIPYSFIRPNATIVLPWWQTPGYCMCELRSLYPFLERKRRGLATGKISTLQIKSQIIRYEAIAAQCDWDVKRNYPLVWMQPETFVVVPLVLLKRYPDWRLTLGLNWRVDPRLRVHSIRD